MDLVQVYECLCDPTRLRIIHLIMNSGPLCVCHIQDILQEPQVKISRHLLYLRRREMLEVRQEGNWRYYSLPNCCTKELDLNLRCLQDCTLDHPLFKRDRERLNNFYRDRKEPMPQCGNPLSISNP
ncbi:MAG: metalloregulator ArsR/SmtB family transcription factor [Verrucomicrobiota bacterium]